LAILAQAAGTKMRGANENVKLLIGQMKEADPKIDSRMTELFDNLLDQGVSVKITSILLVFVVKTKSLFSLCRRTNVGVGMNQMSKTGDRVLPVFTHLTLVNTTLTSGKRIERSTKMMSQHVDIRLIYLSEML
jgi:hypothetical protein